MDDAIAIPTDTTDPWRTSCNPDQTFVRHAGNSDISSFAMSMHRFLASVPSMSGCQDRSHTSFLSDVSEYLKELGRHALGYNPLSLALVIVSHVMRELGMRPFLAVQ